MTKKINLAEVMTTGVSGNTIIGLTTETKPKLKGGQKNPHQGHVTKITENSNVMVFQNRENSAYDKMVKRRLEKEGKDPESFQLGERAWGKRVPGTPFIEHKGKYYLETIFLKPGTTFYKLDEEVVDPNQIEGLQPSSKGGEQGGLEDKVVIRTFAIDSIKEITINGEHYDEIEFNPEFE